MDRSLGLFGALLMVVFLLLARPGCLDVTNPVTIRDYYPPATPQGNTETAQNAYQQASSNSSFVPGNVIIGSFNIHMFGPTKASRPQVMDKLVDVARRFDLLAIQELRSKRQEVIEEFYRQINSDGSRYSWITGSRQGYTSSKEQFAIVYDTAKFRLTSRPYDAPNPNNALHRAPLVASFECTQAPQGRGFTFTVINVHIDPDDVDKELLALSSIMPAIMNNHPNEDDYILMGDFNVSPRNFDKYRWFERRPMALIRPTWSTKVNSRRSIDNIVIDSLHTAEFRNQSGVLDLLLQYGLTESQALRISDHHPIWSVFSTVEARTQIAATPSEPVR